MTNDQAQASDGQPEDPAKHLDERVQKVLQAIAANLYAFRQGGRTGVLRFEVSMQDGQVAERGFIIRMEEDAL